MKSSVLKNLALSLQPRGSGERGVIGPRNDKRGKEHELVKERGLKYDGMNRRQAEVESYGERGVIVEEQQEPGLCDRIDSPFFFP